MPLGSQIPSSLRFEAPFYSDRAVREILNDFLSDGRMEADASLFSDDQFAEGVNLAFRACALKEQP